MINYYDILGVTPTASSRDVRRAYIRQSKKWHPDGFDQGSNPEGWVRANQRFQTINDAYMHLKDPGKRKVHDDSLGNYWRIPKQDPKTENPKVAPMSNVTLQPEYIPSRMPFNSVRSPTPSMPVAEYLRTFIEKPGGFWRNYLKSLNWDNRIALMLLVLMVLYVLSRIVFLAV